MPADGGALGIALYQCLDECLWLDSSQVRTAPAQRLEPRGQCLGFRYRLAVRIVVAEAIVPCAAARGDPVHDDFSELEPLQLVEERAFLFAREELRVEDEAGWLWRELYFEQWGLDPFH